MNDKDSFNKGSSTRGVYVNKFVQNNNLIGLIYRGTIFTWYNQRKANQAIFARSDQPLVNHKWLSLYPTTVLYHLPVIGSHHAPILLNLNPSSHHLKPSTSNFKQSGW